MRSKNDIHIDWTRFGKKSRRQVNAEARKEKQAIGLSGKYKRFIAHIGGKAYEVPIPDVHAIRTRMRLSQGQFAERFHISKRTIQQWEQHRAMPDMTARILLKTIERAPDIVAKAATAVQRELRSKGLAHSRVKR